MSNLLKLFIGSLISFSSAAFALEASEVAKIEGQYKLVSKHESLVFCKDQVEVKYGCEDDLHKYGNNLCIGGQPISNLDGWSFRNKKQSDISGNHWRFVSYVYQNKSVGSVDFENGLSIYQKYRRCSSDVFSVTQIIFPDCSTSDWAELANIKGSTLKTPSNVSTKFCEYEKIKN